MAYTTAAGNNHAYDWAPSCYKRQSRYQLRYISQQTGKEKACYPIGEDKKNEQLRKCKERGIRVISCRKMYPINMEKHQHDFELIHNICMNTIYDMQSGEIPMDEKKYDELRKRADRASYFFGSFGNFGGPISWFTWEEYREAKEMYTSAQMHRMDTCERNGIPYVE